LRDALELLRARRPAGGEPELNRELFFCILEANRLNHDEDNDFWFEYAPAYEARNPPTPGTEDSASERKIPDLYWGYLDHEEPDPRRSSRNFVVECKRLGRPSGAGWVFNVHYADDGIRRFVDPEWRYGKDVGSGAMVGYIESMVSDMILTEVNAAATRYGVLPISRNGTPTPPLHELAHVFDRTFEITPFRLVHLWIEVPV
jgi:hypothetical protein